MRNARGTEERSDLLPADVQANRREILRLASEWGARDVRLLVSESRRTARRGEITVFLVKVDSRRHLSSLAGLLAALHDLLGRRVDVTTEEALSDDLRSRLPQIAIPLRVG